jgi:hypothetical protein
MMKLFISIKAMRSLSGATTVSSFVEINRKSQVKIYLGQNINNYKICLKDRSYAR